MDIAAGHHQSDDQTGIKGGLHLNAPDMRFGCRHAGALPLAVAMAYCGATADAMPIFAVHGGDVPGGGGASLMR
ncbi:hypothetical protein GCM10022626_23440 [[Pseudomonas] carboxydohydrogena]